MPNSSSGLIMATVTVAAGSAEVKRVVAGKGPTLDPILGGFALGALLYGFQAIDPSLAGAFCVLIIVTSLLVNGIAVFSIFPKGGSNT